MFYHKTVILILLQNSYTIYISISSVYQYDPLLTFVLVYGKCRQGFCITIYTYFVLRISVLSFQERYSEAQHDLFGLAWLKDLQLEPFEGGCFKNLC